MKPAFISCFRIPKRYTVRDLRGGHQQQPTSLSGSKQPPRALGFTARSRAPSSAPWSASSRSRKPSSPAAAATAAVAGVYFLDTTATAVPMSLSLLSDVFPVIVRSAIGVGCSGTVWCAAAITGGPARSTPASCGPRPVVVSISITAFALRTTLSPALLPAMSSNVLHALKSSGSPKAFRNRPSSSPSPANERIVRTFAIASCAAFELSPSASVASVLIFCSLHPYSASAPTTNGTTQNASTESRQLVTIIITAERISSMRPLRNMLRFEVDTSCRLVQSDVSRLISSPVLRSSNMASSWVTIDANSCSRSRATTRSPAALKMKERMAVANAPKASSISSCSAKTFTASRFSLVGLGAPVSASAPTMISSISAPKASGKSSGGINESSRKNRPTTSQNRSGLARRKMRDTETFSTCSWSNCSASALFFGEEAEPLRRLPAAVRVGAVAFVVVVPVVAEADEASGC
mmetsp:Transcript_27232/g.68693  ORF Transcript_27232/g.68693 Transcript_27232/m.68693 type:complete len:465 (+) Transcript_27232:2039-3433(+)